MSTLRQDYIEIRNKYKDNPKGLHQQDSLNFLYKFYLENGKKCSSSEEFINGFYYRTEQTVFGLQRVDRDLSEVRPMLDRHFKLTILYDVAPQGQNLGEFLKVIN